MSCFEKLPFFISLLLVDVGVERLLTPKMSSSSSSSSKKDEAVAFLVVDLGLTFWKSSSVLASKRDGRESFFTALLLASGCVVLVVCLVGGVVVTEEAANRLSEPKRSSSSENGSTLVMLLSLLEPFIPAFVDTGSVKTEGLVGTSETEEGEGEEAGKAEWEAGSGSIGLARFWLDSSGGGKAKPDTPGFCPGTSPPKASSLSTEDRWAGCCLPALDWGLRCAEPFARLCMTRDLQSQYYIRNSNNDKATNTALPLQSQAQFYKTLLVLSFILAKQMAKVVDITRFFWYHLV